MKRKTRFNDGGSAGRFDEDLYARARRFVQEQEQRAGEGLALPEEEMPKVSRAVKADPTKPTPPAAPVSTESMGRSYRRAEIPVDESMSGPPKQFSPAMEMGETGRNISTTVGALGGMGRAVAGAPRAAAAAQTLKETGRGMAAPAARAASEGIEAAMKSGPRAGMDVARSTMKGMKGRAEIQAKRAERQKAEAEALEKAKPVLQARKSDKSQRAARTRRTDEDMGIEFSKGGSASRRADGCAQRGKTRGKMY